MGAESFDELDRRRLREIEEKLDLVIKMVAQTQDKVNKRNTKTQVSTLRVRVSHLRSRLTTAHAEISRLHGQLKLSQSAQFLKLLQPFIDELSLQRNTERDEANVRKDTRQTHHHAYSKNKQ